MKEEISSMLKISIKNFPGEKLKNFKINLSELPERIYFYKANFVNIRRGKNNLWLKINIKEAM